MTAGPPKPPPKHERLAAARVLRDAAYRWRDGAKNARETAARWPVGSGSHEACVESAKKSENRAARALRVAEWLERV